MQSPYNIKLINTDNIDYQVEALHFIASSTLDSPEQWKNYIDVGIDQRARVQIILPPNNTLPTASEQTLGKIYLIQDSSAVAGSYTEYITIQRHDEYKWEKIGTTDTDLTEYALKTDVNTAFASVHTTSTSRATSSANGATTVVSGNGGAQTATGNITQIVSAIDTTEAGQVTVDGLAFSGSPIQIPDGELTLDYHGSFTPAGHLSSTVTINNHTHSLNNPSRTVVQNIQREHGGSYEVIKSITASTQSIGTNISTDTTYAVSSIAVDTIDGRLTIGTTPVLSTISLVNGQAMTDISVTKATILTDVTVTTITALYNIGLGTFDETGTGGAHTIYGSSFTFVGENLPLTHTAIAEATYQTELSVVNPTYTPAGTLSKPVINAHIHQLAEMTYDPEDMPVSVSIPNHTHSITFGTHTHTISHSHGITFSTIS